jgi:hypothetical protein
LGLIDAAAGQSPERLVTSQRLKEDQDRVQGQGKAIGYGTDGVRGSHRLSNQKVDRKAHDQEDDKTLRPRHAGLPILTVFIAFYSNTPPRA